MAMIRRDAEWIYAALGKAFTDETGQEWESISKIQMKPIIPEAASRELEIAMLQHELDGIEFEVEGSPLTLPAKYPRSVLDKLRAAGEITDEQRERLMRETAK